MKLFSYRYRFTHAIFEWVVAFVVRIFPLEEERPVHLTPQKILVLKFGGMGEAVLARSLIDRLRERNPGVSVHYLVEERTAETMTYGSEGQVFRYSPASNGLSKALKTLIAIRSQQYDAVVDFEQHSLLTAVFTRATSIPIRAGFIPSEPSHRGRMFTHRVRLVEGESMWSAFVQLGAVLDPKFPPSLMTVPLPVSAIADNWLREWWVPHIGLDSNGPIVAMHLGVGPSAQYRRWAIKRFAELATAMTAIQPNLTILLTGGGSEQLLMTEFKRHFGGRAIEAADLGGLDRTCALLRRCDLLVSADTGIMHLAAAMAVPTVGLFGPNTPDCWAPVGICATYVYATSRSCSPCINSYRRHIPERCIAETEGACMWDITVNDVLEAARRVVRDHWLS